jgi:hypothetical protein
MVYLYDLRHRAAPVGIARALAYFFMLPNVCFPLFPIVDYKTMQRGAYNDDALRIYQTGARRMLRGLVHLALYKIVYFKAVIDPGDVASGMDVARYMFTGYLLYLKISGTYHTVVGLLHMYGFALPPTHNMFYLSSSFTDLWRRVNIYWRDFIEKLVFKPSFFALRRLGEARAIAAATVAASVLTWFLHAYQWFWIRGEFPLVLVDMLFWAALGAFLTLNVMLEARKGRLRSLETPALGWRGSALLALKTAGTFSVIVTLWTLWNTPSLTEIGQLGRALLNSGPLDIAVLAGVPLALGVARVLIGERRELFVGLAPAPGAPAGRFWPQAAIVSAVAAGFIAVALRPVLLAPASPALAELVRDLRQGGGQLNTADVKKLQRGYYEDLGDATRFNRELTIMYGGRPRDWNDSPQSRNGNGAISVEFIPSTTAVFKGALRTINSHGMRDREYTLEHGPDTFRIALVGASHDAGAGVRDDETYENLVEDRLNRELAPRSGKKYEILNFSHGGYDPTQKLAVLEQRMLRFKPDLVLYVAYSVELDWTFGSLPHLMKNGLVDDFGFMASALERAGIRLAAGESPPERVVLESKLAPFADDTLQAVFERFRDSARAAGSRAAVILLDTPDDSPARSPGFDRVAGLARAANLPVLDLQGAYGQARERKSLWIAPWDSHPNAAGHRLLAERLYTLLLRQRLVPGAPAPDSRQAAVQ